MEKLPHPIGCAVFGAYATVLTPRRIWPFTEGYVIFLFNTILATDLTDILLQTGVVARGVLAILLLFSLISWAMIFQKWGMFGRIRRQSNQFLHTFRATCGIPNPQALSSSSSPFASAYAAGYRELQSQVGGIAPNPHPPKLKSLSAITVSMQLASADEVRRVEKGMSWLATTGSVTPFIGLFGTVWGIIDAFAGLGSAGAASPRAVAPRIAEALVTTAAGLFTAIPAVIFYNNFVGDIRSLGRRLGRFAVEVTAKIEKTFTCLPRPLQRAVEKHMQISKSTQSTLSEINMIPFID